MDDYEEGVTTELVAPLFRELKIGIRELLPQIMGKQKMMMNPLDEKQLDIPTLRTFLKEMMMRIGFDFQRGVVGNVEHPFVTEISPNDTRVNTKFDVTQQSFTVTGMIHELGHGLYAQNITPERAEMFLDEGLSLGIHESQSRLLENMIGRSHAFWTYFFPLLQKNFPQLQSATVNDLVNALNFVQPSLIRTESDEVTYNLHIILRFEAEQELLAGTLRVKDLPEVWWTKMQDLVGIAPKTDREGLLQDIHWAWASIGYFPTYTLGNLNAAQLFVKFRAQHIQNGKQKLRTVILRRIFPGFVSTCGSTVVSIRRKN